MYVNGRWLGYPDYRYGVTQPPAPIPAKAKALAKEEQLVSLASSLLERGGDFPFAYEGVIRAGLRAALCRRSWAWPAADVGAALVIEAALHRLGIQRPSWDEGQPEITTGGIRCHRCSNELSEASIASGSIFCGPRCASATLRERRLGWTGHDRAERHAAEWTFVRELVPERACDECGKMYRPTKEHGRYCSKACGRRSRGDLIEHRDCAWCGKSFSPSTRYSSGVYCTTACYQAARAIPIRQCVRCGASFKPAGKAAIGKYCSNECKHADSTKRRERPCDHCGKPYVPGESYHKFCSTTCRTAARVATLVRACPECGDVFTPQRSKAVYCSDRCQKVAGHRRHRERVAAARAQSQCSCGGQCSCSPHPQPT